MSRDIKMFTAILSVVFMLGCALIPLAACNANGSMANDSGTGGVDDFSFSDITASTPFDNLPKLSERKYIPIPVEGSDVSPTVLENSVNGTNYVKAGKTVTLNGDYVFENDGKYVIQKGATLVLLPLTGIDTSFSLRNANDSNEKVIQMESGSRISVFGMTFEIELVDGSEELNLFSVSKCGKNECCSFMYKRSDTGYFEFSMSMISINKDFTTCIADDVTFLKRNMLYEIPGNSIYATGTILPSSEDTGIVLSCTVDVHGIIREGATKETNFSFNSLRIGNLSLSYVPKSSGADVKFSLSANLDYYLNWKMKQYAEITSTGFSVDTGIVDLSIEKGGNKISIDVVSQDPLRLGILPLSLYLKPINGLEIRLSVEDTEVAFEGLKASLNYAPNEKKWSLVSHVDSDVSVNIGKLETVVNYNKTIASEYALSALMVSDFKDVAIHLDGLTFDYNNSNKNWKCDAKLITGTKTLSRCVSQLRENAYEKFLPTYDLFNLLYPIESVITINDFELTGKSGASGTKIAIGQFGIDFSVPHRSAEWNGQFVLDGLVVNSGESASFTLDRLYLRNDIPMTEAFSVLPEFSKSDLGAVSIPNMELEMEGVSFDPAANRQFKGDSMTVDLRKFLNVDEFNLSLSRFAISTGEESSGVSCDSVSGFVVNGDQGKNTFSITDKPKIRLAFEGKVDESRIITLETLRYSIMFEIVSGNAVFNGGSLPFGIKVDSGASFSSQGLTALGFTFEDGCTTSGTVSVDTDVVLPFLYSQEKANLVRIIWETGQEDPKYETIYSLAPQTDGYVLTLDLSNMLKGTLVANDECRLPSSAEGEGFSMTSPDGKNGSFTLSSYIVDLNIPCEKTAYGLTFDGIGTKSYAHGTPVQITSQAASKEGLEFFGWSDGTNMHFPGETFIMPKHDVVMTPVYCASAVPEIVVEGDRTILVVDAPAADMVKICMATFDTWDVMRVTVGDATFEMSKMAFQQMFVGTSKVPCDCIYVQSVQTRSNIDSVDGTMYDIRMYYSQFDSILSKYVIKQAHWSGAYSVVKTSIAFHASADVKDIRVYQVDPDGKLCLTDDVSIVKIDNSTYIVSFDIGHDARYFVAPVYSEMSYVPIIAFVALFLVLAAAGVYFWNRERQGN